MTNLAFIAMQKQLAALGFNPGPADGVGGPKSQAALQAFFDRAGLAFSVDMTADQVNIRGPLFVQPKVPQTQWESLPWIDIATPILRLHETRDNAALRRFLSSDGHALGNPAVLPWCGDFVETCIKLALPGEVFVGSLAQNPYWARNWLLFGVPSKFVYGAVVVFERGPTSGHVGFVVGEDASNYFILGGNQTDAVTIARVAKNRALGARWPKSWPNANRALPKMLPGQTTISLNEV